MVQIDWLKPMDAEWLHERHVLCEDLEGESLTVVDKVHLQVIVHHHLQIKKPSVNYQDTDQNLKGQEHEI